MPAQYCFLSAEAPSNHQKPNDRYANNTASAAMLDSAITIAIRLARRQLEPTTTPSTIKKVTAP